MYAMGSERCFRTLVNSGLAGGGGGDPEVDQVDEVAARREERCWTA